MRTLPILLLCFFAAACSGDPMEDDNVTGSDAGVDVTDGGLSRTDGGENNSSADTGDDDARGGGADDMNNGIDDPPTAVDDRVSALPGMTITIHALSNDTDPEGGPLNIVSIENAGAGVALVTDEDTIEYQAPEKFNGYDTLSYIVADEAGATATARVHITVYDDVEDAAPTVLLPERPGIKAEQLAVIINEADDYSVAVGEYYAATRNIPAENVVRVTLPTTDNVLDPADFPAIRTEVYDALPDRVQALALAWIAPYRVGCMSMSSAFALGFDEIYCGVGQGCQPSAPVDYYGSFSDRPSDDHGLRPAMMLALTNEADGTALIDRGVASDGTFPTSRGYLYRTTDSARSVRYTDFIALPDRWAFTNGLGLDYVDNDDGSGSNTLQDADDVMFYFTGLTGVSGLDTLTFYPGAAADHLTSFGGRLTSTSGQMSVVRWLEAGATGSYGTVVEPCNYQEKFPRVSVFLDHYYRGETLIESYWKSVSWPGEGVFVGEPLARPYGRSFLSYSMSSLTIGTSWLAPGVDYEVVASDTVDGPFDRVGEVIQRSTVGYEQIVVEAPMRTFYRLRVVE